MSTFKVSLILCVKVFMTLSMHRKITRKTFARASMHASLTDVNDT